MTDTMMLGRTEPATTAALEADRAATRGFFFALAAYTMWGVQPLYMKAVAHISSVEVVAHRVIWSVPIALVVLWALGRTADIAAAFRSPRTLAMAALTAVIIGANWGVYVWAIAVERTIETALGYYINPLVTVVLGATLLGERLDRLQLFAIALAVVAVVVLTVEQGGLPWVSLFLAFSFAAYGYLRKTLPIGPSQGFFLEVVLMLPFALIVLGWMVARGESGMVDGGDFWLLAMAGPITAVPLLLYAFGAKLLRISTIGLMQYIGPTIQAVIAVFVFGEPFGPERAVAFGLIWLALGLYTWSMLRHRRS
jgi:chloramphenicol-sensitive protein RarD